jgi:hypothetical protein
MSLEPKDHTHQVTLIAFARAKYGNDLILADFNLAVGWSIRQTAKFNSPPIFRLYDITQERVYMYEIDKPSSWYTS